jgi:peroxiredoxin Q/BCP
MHQQHAMLLAGQIAPLFSLPDADMERVKLAQYRGKKNVVLYFYPRDGTPGCTLQATDFSDHESDFALHDCVVIGVSPDDCLRHAEFRDAVGVSITLLSDANNEVCARYGVLRHEFVDPAHGNGAGDGSKRNVMRATFIIDKRGIVQHALYNVTPRGHAAEVLALVRKLPR